MILASELWNRRPPVHSGVRRLRVLAPAKLNLFLEVVRRRPDGYHNLETIFQQVSLADELAVSYDSHSSGAVIFSCSPLLKDVRPGENLVQRAVASFCDAFNVKGRFTIRLKKNVPAGAGLGGGSSDAAAALLCCAWLSGKLRASPPIKKKLADLARRLGADVPFFLKGGTCVGTALGDKLRPISTSHASFVLVFPGFPVATAGVYKGLNPALTRRVSIRKITQELVEGVPPRRWARHLYNRLETVVLPKHPVLRELKERLVSLGCAGALMSGSGSSVFGVVSSRRQGQGAVRRLRALGHQAWLVRTLGDNHGNHRDPNHTAKRPAPQSLCQHHV